MTSLALVCVRESRCRQWALDPSLKRCFAPILGARLVQFEAMQGQAVLPLRRMALWASAIHQLNTAHGLDYTVTMCDAAAENLSLWHFDAVVFFMDACNASRTMPLAASLLAQGIRVVIASGRPDVYAGKAPEALDGAYWTALSLSCVPDVLGVSSVLEEAEVLPDWRATTLGDYCPYFVPVALGQQENGRVVARSIEAIMSEIGAMRESGLLDANKRIVFDSPFEDETMAMAVLLELSKRLVTEDLLWGAWVSSAYDARDVALLRRAGLCLAVLGKTMDFSGLMHDGQARQVSACAISLFKSRGIFVCADFTFGSDHESLESFEAAKRVIAAGVDLPMLSLFTPYPEMPQFDDYERQARIVTYDWAKYDGGHVVFVPQRLNAVTLERHYAAVQDWALSKFRLACRFVRPSKATIGAICRSALPLGEAAALRLALTSAARYGALHMSAVSLLQLSEVMLVGKY